MGGAVCATCRPASFLDGVVAVLPYDDHGSSGRLLKALKYNYARDVAGTLTKLWKHFFLQASLPAGTLLPVPLHIRRCRERGFNQAETIVASIVDGARLSDAIIPSICSRGLIRSRYTSQQARLTRAERLANIRNAFAWTAPKNPPAQILLVDDIFTTGATLQAAAYELKLRGAKRVWGLVVARG